MADATADIQNGTPKKGGKMGLILGVVGAMILGGGSFVFTSGMLGGTTEEAAGSEAVKTPEEGKVEVIPLPSVSFVQVDPLIISLDPNGVVKHLRFGAQLEVFADYEEEVAGLMPRILDVLNGYLRAVDADVLQNPSALMRLRAQMLRRVQLVTGEGRVRDLLVVEFVLN